MLSSFFKIDGIEVTDAMLPPVEELPRSLQDVAEIVGVKKAIELSFRFQGTTVNFPMLTGVKRKIRNSAIRNDYDRGLKASVIARKYNLGERQVWNILGTIDE